MSNMKIKVNLTGDNAVEHCLKVTVNAQSAMDIVGEGHFTDEALTANNGTHIDLPVGTTDVYFANGSYEVNVTIGKQMGIGGNPQVGAFEMIMDEESETE
jgi:hypothetical protein